MLTTGAKLWFGVTTFTVVAAVAYFLATSGEELGSVVLLGVGAGAAILGVAAVAGRDADVPATAEAPAGPVARSTLPAYWPALGALGVALMAVGLAGGNALAWAGAGLLAIVLVEWMVQGWAERSTVDPAYNRALRNRIMNPFEVPALAVLGAAVVVLAFSRVLLALPKTGSTVVAIVVASVILGGAALVASRPRISSSMVSGIVVVGAVVLLAGGIVGAVVGERDFEEHHAEEGAGEGERTSPQEDAGETADEAGGDDGDGAEQADESDVGESDTGEGGNPPVGAEPEPADDDAVTGDAGGESGGSNP